MALDHVHARNDDPALLGRNAQDVAYLALAATGDDLHPVALLDLQFDCHG